MDSFPCSTEELRLLGYRPSVSPAAAGAAAIMAAQAGVSAPLSNGAAAAAGGAAGAAAAGGPSSGAAAAGPSAAGQTAPSASVASVPDLDSALPRPDLGQMVPFKPRHNWLPGEHRWVRGSRTFTYLFFTKFL